MFARSQPHLQKFVLVGVLLVLLTLSTRMAPAQDDNESLPGDAAKEAPQDVIDSKPATASPTLTEEVFCSTPNLPIPDSDPSGIGDIMEIPDFGTISDLALQLNITHTWVGDLRIDLEHTSTGRSANVLNEPRLGSGSCQGDDIGITIRDGALLDMQSDCSDDNPAYPETDDYRPAESFDVFEGEDVNGFWRLVVSDNASLDTGTLQSWCLVTSTETASLTIVKEAGPAEGTDFAFESDLPVATYLDQWGGSGGGEGQLDAPLGMAVDDAGNVYVADAFNNRIQKFDAEGNFLLRWGSLGSGDGQFDGPRDVVVDVVGNVYVVDKFNDRVQKFTSNGDYLQQWGGPGNGDGQFNDPVGIAIGFGGAIYVTDTGNHRVQRFLSDGSYFSQWGSGPGGADGQFNEPKFIDVDPAGNVFVTDFGNQRVQKFDQEGAFLLKWGFEDAAGPEGSLDRPEGLAVDDAGNVYVGEWADARVQMFDNDGNFLGMWGYGVRNGAPSFQVCTGGCRAGVPGNDEGQFENPEGIAVDNKGHIYVASSTNDRIQKFSSNTFMLDNAMPDDEDGITKTQLFPSLNPGAFTVTETVSAGWTLSDITCDSEDWSADVLNGSLSINLAAGVDVICVFTNQGPARLTLVKEAEPADGTDFAFSSDLPAGTYLNQWGSFGSGDGQFTSPEDIVVAGDGNVYVADASNHRIQKFDAEGNYLGQWGSQGSGDGQFAYPAGIAVDAGANLYVADAFNNRIQKFDAEGNYLGQWGSLGGADGQFAFPEDVAVAGDGNVYVADASNHRIQKFDAEGNYLSQWGSLGGADGQFTYPAGITVDSGGNVHVADAFNNRIQKFDAEGNYLGQWGGPGSGDGQFDFPAGIAVDAAGNFYVTDRDNHRVQKFDGEGNYLDQWGGPGSGDGQLDLPAGIAVDAAGNVYVIDRLNHRVQTFSANIFLLDDAVPDDDDGVAGRRVFNGLPAGGYEIVESLPGGWSLADISCDSGNWSADVGNQMLSVTLADGDDVTCAFSNELEPPPAETGDLTIVLDATPEDDTPFAYSGDGGLGTFTLSDPSDNSETFAGIPTGDYMVTQTSPPGWMLSTVSCSGGPFSEVENGVSVTVGDGASVNCTFSNERAWQQFLPAFFRNDP